MTGRLSFRQIDRILWTLAALAFLATVATGWQWYRGDHDQQTWRRTLGGAALPVDPTLNEQIGRALYLGGQGDSEQALKLYQQVEAAAPDLETIRIARFNSANLNLQEAFELIADDQTGRALPLVEVAKQIYRQLLYEQPADWRSRYNLSRALLLVPDPVTEPDPIDPPDDAERAVTTMRGYSPGMP